MRSGSSWPPPACAGAELAGLRWNDIDFTRARLTPRLPRVAVNYQVHSPSTKTPSGRRSLALDPATLEALGEHRRPPDRGARRLSSSPDTNDLVFTWPDGRPLHPDLITDWFQRHAKQVVLENQDGRTKVGLPGDPPARRAAQLRDRSFWPLASRPRSSASASATPTSQITLDTYSHVIPGRDGPAAATVARAHPRRLREHRVHGRARQRMLPILLPNGRRPHSREEVRGEVPGELGGGGGI